MTIFSIRTLASRGLVLKGVLGSAHSFTPLAQTRLSRSRIKFKIILYTILYISLRVNPISNLSSRSNGFNAPRTYIYHKYTITPARKFIRITIKINSPTLTAYINLGARRRHSNRKASQTRTYTHTYT